jgi:hypothetical protein
MPGFLGRYSGVPEGRFRKERTRKIMHKNTWFFKGIFGIMLVFALLVTGCTNPAGDTGDEEETEDPIKWDPNDKDGTLTILNNASKDMVIFQGQTPSITTILGGVRAGKTGVFDISDDVADFDVGGYMILRGMTLDEYKKNKTNLSTAKAEYSAMATYGQGQKFRTEINPAYSGDFYFKVANAGKIGMELRKNSPEGEKIGYLPAMETNYVLYTNTSEDLTIFPVYVFYSKTSKKVTTIRATSFDESASVGPRPVTDNSFQTIRLPNNTSLQWDQIAKDIVYPVAFITVTNNVDNQSGRFAVSSKVYFAQNGYDSINSGETLTFEVKAADAGQQLNLNCTLYGGTTTVAVKTTDGQTPVIKNGYDYTVSLSYNDGALTDPASYTATITEGTKRDIKEEIISL